jgi:hypothetical protein
MSSATPTAVDPKSAYAILDRNHAALSAIDPNTLVSVRIGRERVMELTHGLFARAARVLDKAAALSRPVFRKEYLTAQGELLVDLKNRAMAFYASDLDSEAGFTSAQHARRAELAGIVRSADRELFPVVDLLFGSDPALGEEVRQIASGGGVRDDADDVLRLTRILLEHWSRVQNRAPVTRPGVEKAQAQATELAGLIDSQGAGEPEARHPEARLHALGRGLRRAQLAGPLRRTDARRLARRLRQRAHPPRAGSGGETGAGGADSGYRNHDGLSSRRRY